MQLAQMPGGLASWGRSPELGVVRGLGERRGVAGAAILGLPHPILLSLFASSQQPCEWGRRAHFIAEETEGWDVTGTANHLHAALK